MFYSIANALSHGATGSYTLRKRLKSTETNFCLKTKADKRRRCEHGEGEVVGDEAEGGVEAEHAVDDSDAADDLNAGNGADAVDGADGDDGPDADGDFEKLPRRLIPADSRDDVRRSSVGRGDASKPGCTASSLLRDDDAPLPMADRSLLVAASACLVCVGGLKSCRGAATGARRVGPERLGR